MKRRNQQLEREIEAKEIPDTVRGILREKGWQKISISSLQAGEESPLGQGIKTELDSPRFKYFIQGYEATVGESGREDEVSRFRLQIEKDRLIIESLNEESKIEISPTD